MTSISAQPILAQSNTSVNVITGAVDAFGEKVGDEQIGVYNESQVRGFSLQSAGNYRIDGHYFVRAEAMTDDVLRGSTIQVGTSALQTDFPAPGGVVAFGLRQPGEDKVGYVVSTGLRNYLSPFVQANGWRSSQDGAFSFTWGTKISPDVTYGDGTRGYDYSIGAVPRWTRNGLAITVLLNAQKRSANGADYGFVSSTETLLPDLPGTRAYGAPWARHDVTAYKVGVAADMTAGSWELRASSYLSKINEPTDDFTLLITNPALIARATVSKSRNQLSRSVSHEIGASRDFTIGNSTLRVYGAARYRQSDSVSTSGESFDLGIIDLRQRRYPANPALSGTAAYAKTTINQTSVGVGSEIRFGKLFQARSGVQRVWYDKSVVSADDIDKAVSGPWLYDAALIVPISDTWLAYTTYTRGLEEKGTAPSNALNRNDELPSVQATQIEAGVRGRPAEDLSFVAALFQISKPTTGFDDTGRFGLIGNIRHRGAELSLTGRITDSLSLTGGIVAFEPRITSAPGTPNPPIASVGVQPVTASISANYEVENIAGLSLDGRFAYNGRRPATGNKAFYTPAQATIDVGTRYRTQIAGAPTAFRARVQNLTNATNWIAQSSGLLRLQSKRALSLAVEFTFSSL